MLPEVFFPGRDAEYLDEPFGVFAVSVQLPPGRAGTAPGPAELFHRRQEIVLPFWGNGEVHGDQYRPGVRLRVEGQPRVGPVNRGLGVEVAGLRHPPEQTGQGSGEYHDRSGEDGRPEPEPGWRRRPRAGRRRSAHP